MAIAFLKKQVSLNLVQKLLLVVLSMTLYYSYPQALRCNDSEARCQEANTFRNQEIEMILGLFDLKSDDYISNILSDDNIAPSGTPIGYPNLPKSESERRNPSKEQLTISEKYIDDLLDLGIAYHKSTRYTKDSELAAKLFGTLNHWLKHHEIKPRWDVTFKHGAPLIATKLDMILLLMMEPLVADIQSNSHQANEILRLVLEHTLKIFNQDPPFNAQNRGQNWIGRFPRLRTNAASASILKGPQSFDDLKAHIEAGLRDDPEDLIYQGQGRQVDGTFFHHGNQMYNAPYGLKSEAQIAAWFKYFEDTSWEYDAFYYQLLEDRVLDYMKAVSYKEHYYDLAIVGGKSVVHARGSILMEPHSVRGAIKSIQGLKHFKLKRLDELGEYEAILKNQQGYHFSKQFWIGDYYAHQKPEYFVGFKTVSIETKSPEWFPNFFIGSGMTSILVRGDEYQQARRKWDFTALPGTTVERVDHTEANLGGGGAAAKHFGRNRFNGGASNGEIGVSGFQLNRRKDERDRVANLQANIGRFFFHHEVVAMGSSIERKKEIGYEDDVRTTINQTELKTNVEWGNTSMSGAINFSEARKSRPVSIQKKGTGLPTDSFRVNIPTWFWHDGVGYLIIPQNGNFVEIELWAEVRTGRWGIEIGEKGNIPIFQLGINHGIELDDSSNHYVYVILPNITPSEIASYVKEIPFEIIANTAEKQIIYHKELKATQAIFYEAATLDNNHGLQLEVDKELVIMLDESDSNEIKLYYANPMKRPPMDISSTPMKINKLLLSGNNDVILDEIEAASHVILDFETDTDFETKPQQKVLSIPSRNFLIGVKGSEDCPSDGKSSIEVNATEVSTGYQVELSGQEINMSKTFGQTEKRLTFESVSPGKYSVRIWKDDFEQIYEVIVKELPTLVVQASVDEVFRVLNLDLKGGRSYIVSVNGVQKQYDYSGLVSIPIEEDITDVKVSTPDACQGQYYDRFILESSVAVYPNPVEKNLNVVVPHDKDVTIQIFNSSGRRVYISNNSHLNGNSALIVPMSEYTAGVYIVRVSYEDYAENFKIVKK